jgi:uncharacterized protein (TIGR00730 family)
MKSHIAVPKKRQHCSINKIAIYGSADVDAKHPLYKDVFKVSQHLAYQDKIIVNGGGPGVMDAATKGAQAGGGKTIGVTFYPKDMPEFEGRFYKNIVDKEIKTATYVERMFALMEEADIFICFQGGTGTLSEWATALLLAHLYYGHHKPIIMYGSFWNELMEVVNKHFFIGEKERSVYKVVNNIDELDVAIDQFEQELHDNCGLPHKPSADIDVEGASAELDKYGL